MKPKRFENRVSADLHFLRFPAVFERPVTAECLNCRSELTLHQPDMDMPERLLGVCEECKHWYLIDLLRDVSQGVMVWLPNSEVVRDLSHENSPAGISIMSGESETRLPTPPAPTDEPQPAP